MSSDVSLFRELRSETIALARDHADKLERGVPAAPAWRVRDVLAHLAGVCDDIVHGNLAGVATDEWTAAQVEKRCSWTADEVLADWEQHGEAVDRLITGAPPGTFGQLIFDAWTHEQDVRGALKMPGSRDATATDRAWEWATEALDRRDSSDRRAALSLVADGTPRTIGVEPTAATVRASRFELLRAMTGRRSVAQVRSWDWTGNPDPQRLLLAPFFRPPDQDLRE